jgi:Tfp pilus assembly ATPase PilU
MEAARREGCVTMDQSLQALYAAHQVSLEQAMRHMRNPRTLSPEGQTTADPATEAAVKSPTGNPDPRRKLPWSR